MSLVVAAEAGIVTLTLDRPERRNFALSEGLLAQIEAALEAIAGDAGRPGGGAGIAATGPVFGVGMTFSEMVGRSRRGICRAVRGDARG